MSDKEDFVITVQKGKSCFRNVEIKNGKVMINERLLMNLSKKATIHITVEGDIEGNLSVKSSSAKVDHHVSGGDTYTSYGGVARSTGGNITINNGDRGRSTIKTSKPQKKQTTIAVIGDVGNVEVDDGVVNIGHDCKTATVHRGQLHIDGDCGSAKCTSGQVVVKGNSETHFH